VWLFGWWIAWPALRVTPSSLACLFAVDLRLAAFLSSQLTRQFIWAGTPWFPDELALDNRTDVSAVRISHWFTFIQRNTVSYAGFCFFFRHFCFSFFLLA